MTDAEWVPREREESFGVIVFRKNKDVLLVKTDHWGFPKGHAEEGEDGITAAVREVKEETGIIPDIGDPTKTLTEEYEIRRERFTTKKTVTYWVGSGEGTPLAREGEIAETKWVPIKEGIALLSHESAKNILKSLI